MFRNHYSGRLLTVFFACGSKPLCIWDVYCKNGHVRKFLDPDIKSTVIEICGSNVSTTYMVCPKGKLVLGISLPFLVMIVKNLKKYFSFEVTILDDTGVRRRFRISNFQSKTQVHPLCTAMPIGLSDGWNQIQFNLAEFTRRAYKTQFLEVLNVKINCNIVLRRVYFCERLFTDEELPADYKLFFPLASKVGKPKRSTEINEKQIAPAERKGSLLGIALAASVHSYRRSLEKMASIARQEGQTNHIKASLRQVINEEKQETDETITDNAIVEGGSNLNELLMTEDTERVSEAVIAETERELQIATAEQKMSSEAAEKQSTEGAGETTEGTAET